MILLILAALASVPSDADSKQPQIELSKSFDVATAGAPVSLEYSWKNDSDRPIRILDYKVSCGCVVVDRPAGEIAPGASAVVHCSMDTSEQKGRVVQWVNIKTDHPTKPLVRLELRGVIRAIWTDPQAIDFGTITSKRPPVREVVALAAALPGAKIASVKVADPEAVRAEVRPARLEKDVEAASVAALGQVELTWTGVRKGPGPYQTVLLIETVPPAKVPIRIPVTAHLAGASNLTPSRLLFGVIKPDAAVTRTCTVKLEAAAGADLREIAIESDHPLIRATIESVDAGSGSIRVKATAARPSGAPGGVPPGLLRGQINAKLGGRLVFSIPYLAFVESKEAGTAARQDVTNEREATR